MVILLQDLIYRAGMIFLHYYPASTADRMMAAGPTATQAGARQASGAGSLDDADFPVLLRGEEREREMDIMHACGTSEVWGFISCLSVSKIISARQFDFVSQ